MTDAKRNPSPIELAWDEAARGYDVYFSPRFAPYLATALGTLIGRASDLPSSGCIVVPCAGPGRELGPLARAFPGRQIVASEHSAFGGAGRLGEKREINRQAAKIAKYLLRLSRAE